MSGHHSIGSAGGMSATMRRTATFLGVGAGLLLLGSWLTLRPTLRQRAPAGEEQVKILFPELADPAKAASLEIVSFDDETATLKPFKVVKSGGVWVLPSHDNYPADAKDQLAAAATELVERPVLDVVSDSPGDHETYGVIEPDPEKIKVGMTGIGQLVEIRDASGTKLARLIVGKVAKRPGAANDTAGRTLRYVRRAGQDRVYLVDLDTSKFSTSFDDWIEKDLLKLSPWDVRRLVLDDYTLQAVESGGRMGVVQKRTNRFALAYDDKDAAWSLVKLEGYDAKNQAREEKLAADEELASARLNELRNALGDLKIIDVVRKPAGLSADLKADEKFTDDPQAKASMQERGFLPLGSGDILSVDGETIVGMKDGVEYVLRFGAGTSVAAEQAAKDAGGSEGVAPAGETSGRYLLVMARFNDGLLEKPKLEPVPEAPAAGEATKAEDKAEPKDAAADELKKAEEEEAKAQAAIEERRRVEAENRRRQEQYDEQVKAAEKRVRDLNGRFADWYYVVSDKEYEKIHLDRAALVQKKAAEEKKE
ncbi:MAG: DUF4340 domain-containing protein [Pirellulales bacterium]